MFEKAESYYALYVLNWPPTPLPQFQCQFLYLYIYMHKEGLEEMY